MIYLEQRLLVTVGLVLIIILGVWSYYLYHQSNYDNMGNELGCLDTIRNIFGFPTLNYIISGREEGDMSHMNQTELDKEIILQEEEQALLEAEHQDSIPEEEKEVFNIDNSTFTYDEAQLICKAYDSELASYNQMVKAHEKGANWCNYGWSKDQMGLFPIQQSHYDELQSSDDKSIRNSCGKPGINGGKFTNKNLKFGVNCYGVKPKADPSKINYVTEEDLANNLSAKQDMQIKKYREMIDKGDMEIRPFNDSKWSKYSTKKSTYMLTPKNSLEIVVTEDTDSIDNDPRALTKESDTLEIVDTNMGETGKKKSNPSDVL